MDYSGTGVQAPSKDQLKSRKISKPQQQNESKKAAPSALSKTDDQPRQLETKERGAFLFTPTPRWSEVQLPKLPSVPSTSSSKPHASANDVVAHLQRRANELLSRESQQYSQIVESGKGYGPGMLSGSDARFISDLLGPGARGGTLSDRIAALTLLAQSSPIHNFGAMETLLGMAEKKGREESSRATRALADWLASGGGLSDRKLRYFRDQPYIPQIIALEQSSSLSQSSKLAIEVHLLVAAFEDKLKRSYFEFLRILETQSHDTLPFMRQQAVTQIFFLLKEKSEQEHNLLRMLVNKLGDTDRSVASKASGLVLSLLNVHPNMKPIVTNEISTLVMHTPNLNAKEGKSKINTHARYFGILTLNQTMLSNGDDEIAGKLLTLYFELFNQLLGEENTKLGGKEEVAGDEDENEPTTSDGNNRKRDKGRWRDAKKGPGKPKPKQGASSVIQDADSKIIAAILTGVRRALPFAKVDTAVFERHIDTLFRITHSSTFNISVQALQLIFQVCLVGKTNVKETSFPTHLQDRFYRALYASLLDSRLATTSKQAMYLNLFFKAVKVDVDDARTKAFVKRLVQLLTSSEPPFICGSLYLLGELFKAKPGLYTLLNDSEDDGEEHFRDVDEDVNGENKVTEGSNVNFATTQVYDGLKRDPRFTKAETTCLWELTPLLSHFHPSVSLCAAQLLTAQRINTSADLTLHTLGHFLDRFVYRNPKQKLPSSKGASLMQPALHASGEGRTGVDGGVVRLKGIGIRQDEYVNDEHFWKKNIDQVPADQMFFHKFFNLRRGHPAKGDELPDQSSEEENESIEVHDQDLDEDLSDVSDQDSDAEREIWKAMKESMPHQGGDDILDEDDDDEIDPALMESDDDSTSEEYDDDLDDGADNVFEEDEEDIMPFAFNDSQSSSEEDQGSSQKRKAEDDQPKSKSQLRRAERKKRKTMPTFASADDYAHLLD